MPQIKFGIQDITYLIFKGKRLYLSTIIDLYDRHVVSYKISKFNDLNIVINTLNEAIAKEKYISEGFVDYIAKPFSKDQIKEKLDFVFKNTDVNLDKSD